MLPKVSILIPCYNADRWIAQAIQSALDQTYSNKEVIVVDDGSSDRSLDVIKSFGDRIRWESQPNRGGNITRNRLLELSTSEWIQYLDADDYLLPDKIEKQLQFLSKTQQADIIYSPSIFEYWDGNHSRQEVLTIPEPHDPWILLARWYLPQTGSPLWKKQAILDAEGWKPDQPCCQEHELYLRLLKAGKQFKHCPDASSIYRQWSESTVCKRDKSETFRQRLVIEDAIEQHLRNINQLTLERLHAINQARFECARMIWLSNQRWANEIIATIKTSDRHFVPSGSAAPQTYRFTYKLFGFSIAEQIAGLKRSLTHPTTVPIVH
jgi:glycosyltransferase involved in cell wall biosynthesis